MGEKKITNADIEAATGKPRVLCIGRGLRLQTTPKKQHQRPVENAGRGAMRTCDWKALFELEPFWHWYLQGRGY